LNEGLEGAETELVKRDIFTRPILENLNYAATENEPHQSKAGYLSRKKKPPKKNHQESVVMRKRSRQPPTKSKSPSSPFIVDLDHSCVVSPSPTEQVGPSTASHIKSEHNSQIAQSTTPQRFRGTNLMTVVVSLAGLAVLGGFFFLLLVLL